MVEYRVIPQAECEGIHPSNRAGRVGFVIERRPDLAGAPIWQYTGSPTFDDVAEAQRWIDRYYTRSSVTHQPALLDVTQLGARPPSGDWRQSPLL